MALRSINFTFLAGQYPTPGEVIANAERDVSQDPVGSLMRVRLFAELLARQVATKLRVANSSMNNFADVVDQLAARGIPAEALDLFNGLRRAGNDATHRATGTPALALAQLRTAHQLTVWYWRTFHDGAFKPAAFVVPPDPSETLRALQQQVALLEQQTAQHSSAAASARVEAESAKARAEIDAFERALAEDTATKATNDAVVLEQMAREYEQQARDAKSAPDAAKVIEQFVAAAAKAAKKIHRTEAEVRGEIDAQLRAVGWEADSEKLRYSAGTRPEAGHHRAIAEWPTKDGSADYVLFAGLRAIGVVEAKRDSVRVADKVPQAERYSRGFRAKDGVETVGGPWDEFRVPFVFASNGRPYLQQLENESGVWFRDVRNPRNHARALHNWYSPDGLLALLAQDVGKATAELRKSPVASLRLRPYQNAAIEAVEKALADGRPTCLVAMATGTGKTRTAIGLVYRLIEAGRFHRVLFLVDRTALGEQTANALKDYKVANEKTFAQIFGIKELKDIEPDRDTRLHVATVQGMTQRVLADDPDARPPVDQYDCIIVDECHRGYTLDREMSEAELGFRDQRDYISRYRKVIEYFDAVKIGLTATPALQTTQIFGQPIYQYTFTQAVIDKMLVPQEPPYRIVTELARKGIQYKVGDTVTTYNRDTRAIELAQTPDELDFDVESFNRQVKTPAFNRAVCAHMAHELDPHADDKTLVFCVDDDHATEVTQLLKEELDREWHGVDDDAVVKITGSVDRPLEQIRRYRNERQPSVVVTVDLLTTGIDIPKIANLVFMRRVRSRILYEQMLGRATRLSEGKESFRVYDAVGQTDLIGDLTDMKPTAIKPTFTFQQIAREMVEVTDERAREQLRDQLVAKMRRKRTAVEAKANDEFVKAAGMGAREAIESLDKLSAPAAAGWLMAHPEAVGILDRVSGVVPKVVVHNGPDRVIEAYQDFGGRAPADYLEAFGAFVKDNVNRIHGLTVVATRPANLTRKELGELATALDDAGFTEIKLRSAWKSLKNEDVAASIVGFVRQQAVGDALVPYSERVEHAVKRVLASRKWTRAQEQWLTRIGKQLAATVVVDRAALDQEPFSDHGGFDHVNSVFGGKAEQVLQAISEAVWKDAG